MLLGSTVVGSMGLPSWLKCCALDSMLTTPHPALVSICPPRIRLIVVEGERESNRVVLSAYSPQLDEGKFSLLRRHDVNRAKDVIEEEGSCPTWRLTISRQGRESIMGSLRLRCFSFAKLFDT